MCDLFEISSDIKQIEVYFRMQYDAYCQYHEDEPPTYHAAKHIKICTHLKWIDSA